ncbi:hypothetical protein DPMN_003863 [Dreissena polymorpha]|uniref:Uncharacterized protein n=1 Tax=Dreissena polymorpha TaxID=45954 RepID=A0A9D4MLR5_DREPO|nr:hypothetical protein DPMN_003863 [Dreissena polymorpha]
MGVCTVIVTRRVKMSERGVKVHHVKLTEAGQTGQHGPRAVSRVGMVPIPGTGHVTTLHPPTVE